MSRSDKGRLVSYARDLNTTLRITQELFRSTPLAAIQNVTIGEASKIFSISFEDHNSGEFADWKHMKNAQANANGTDPTIQHSELNSKSSLKFYVNPNNVDIVTLQEAFHLNVNSPHKWISGYNIIGNST